MTVPLSLSNHFTKGYPVRKAFQRGPQILALDDKISSSTLPSDWIGSQVYNLPLVQSGLNKSQIFVPFADASQNGGNVTVLFDTSFAVSTFKQNNLPKPSSFSLPWNAKGQEKHSFVP